MTEKRVIHNVNRYVSPALTVDALCVRERAPGKEILLIRRKNPPFQGAWAIPGGFVDVGETTEAAALRELQEETGIQGRITRLLGVYSDPDRDPRGHTVSVVYMCACEDGATECAGTDATEARWWPLQTLPDLAFDHAEILADLKESLQGDAA